MREIKPEEITSKTSVYLPHHCVLKSTSTTTRLRVVFDGSSKTTSGKSLNDVLYTGPSIQSDLFSILIRFRTHQYVLTGDVAKMYRQVLIDPSQTSLQRILWREDKTQPIRTFELLTVTYGTAPASFLATRCLKELADEFSTSHVKAAKVIAFDCYMDDILTGSDTIEETIELKEDVTTILKSGGFHLRKFKSNNSRIVKSNLEQAEMMNLTNNDQNEGTLGVKWDPNEDYITYTIPKITINRSASKRDILSHISQLFDPLGLLSPITIVFKIIMQDLWRLKLDWRESVPQSIFTLWSSLTEEMNDLTNLKVPRKIITSAESENELFGFADASSKAYGACIYLKSTDKKTKKTETHLVCAKSRVAPIKEITIPRLELCAAVLLAQLMHKLIEIGFPRANRYFCYTDSTIVLAWIKSTSTRFKTFVANRISEIQTLTNAENWSHIDSRSNPADICSRGTSTKELMTSEMWWHGPELIETSPDDTVDIDSPNLPERRALISTNTKRDLSWIERFSSWTKLVRNAAIWFKFVEYLRTHQVKPLNVDDIRKAESRVIRVVQHNEFTEEIQQLQRTSQVTSNSKIKCLVPFIDNEGVIRIRGRLSNANLPEMSKHPILLPNKHHITTLIIREEHQRHLHSGVQGTLSAIRRKYWPLRGKTCVKRIVRECVVCNRYQRESLQPLMADLPRERVTVSRPFSYTGVDYAGPFLIKAGLRRSKTTLKSYVAVFICFSTKAIHLELVTDLTADNFIACLRRFIARRGKPTRISSDNATNFVAANKQLQELLELYKVENQERIKVEMEKEGIEWTFIPPRTPHQGGLWEAGVRSFKHHFKRVGSNVVFSYEELNTLICQIEAILNSRPLYPLSDDPNDFQTLTPGHFLIGDAITISPNPDLSDINLNRLSRWQLVQRLQQTFWRRWSQDYLNHLQTRVKWNRTQRKEDLQPGQMVLIRDDQQPPHRWPLGRVVEVYPGTDGIIRTAKVITSHGSAVRAINKLCILWSAKAEK